MNYATLYQIKAYLNLLTANTDDALLTSFLGWSTSFIERYKGRRYDVRLATLRCDVPATPHSSFGVYDGRLRVGHAKKPLLLKDDLLEVVEFLNGDGSVISANQYFLDPSESTPKSSITLRNNVSWAADDNGDTRQALSLKAYWGYHPDYANAFVDSLDTVLDTTLTSGATTIHVADVNGIDANLESPRFQAGQLLRIDDEFMLLIAATAVTSADDTLTVKRGYNGTTAAAHTTGSSIKVYKPMGTILQACERLVAWRYHQKDVDTFDKTYAAGTGVVSVPAAVPADVRDILGAKGRPS